jgi:choline transport protein
MILDLAVIWYPNYQLEHWHQYLIYVALVWVAMAFNILPSRLIPLLNKLFFVLSALTLSATTITLFAVARNSHSLGKFIFTDTTNESGWSSDGWAFMLAIGNAVYSYLGSDCGAHMCEEISNPGKNVPKVILVPLAMGLITAFPFTVSLMYSITSLSNVLATPTGLPLLEIYYQGTGSNVGASVLLTLFAFCFFSCLVANSKCFEVDHERFLYQPIIVTTCSRTLWAVSRDGALPWSHSDLRCYFPRIINRLQCHGQRCNHLSADLMHHTPSSCPLPWHR